MINNRQNGRRRGRGGQRPGNGNPGRADNGSRIDNRARGNASQLHEKYKALASEAQRQGDRVNTEYYLQFADHYFRVLSENRSRFEEQNQRRQPDSFEDDFDGEGEDYGNEGEPVRADQYQPRQDDRPRYEERPRQDDRPRFEDRPRQNRDERPRYEDRSRQESGDDQNRAERPRQSYEDRPRQDNRPRFGQDERPRRDERPRGDDQRRPNRDNGQANGRANGAAHVREQPAPAMEARDDTLTPHRPETEEASTVRAADMQAGDAPAPRRRGRPPRARTEEAAAPEGFDADRLPPSLSVTASAEPDAGAPEAAEKPRRRRRTAAVEAPPAA